jgi:hypothetical protein
VADISASIAKEVSKSRHRGVLGGSLEDMAGVVAVLVVDVALHAKIVVVACGAGNELALVEYLDTAVASARGLVGLLLLCDVDNGLLLLSKGAGHLLSGLGLGANTLGGAVDDASVLDEALDHPVARAGAVDAGVDARLAQVVVAVVADAAMVVLVFQGHVAVVAIHNPGGLGGVHLGAES